MNLENYLAVEEYYPIVIRNGCTGYAIKYLKEKYSEARRCGDMECIRAFAQLRTHICGWVRTHLEEKVVDTDLVDRIMMDIKWSTVLQEICDHANDPPSSDSDTESENELPVPLPRRRA